MNLWKVLNLITLLGLLALAILFIRQSRGQSPAAEGPRLDLPQGTPVVFVNSDTLRKHYDLVKEMEAELESQFSDREKEITARQQRYEKDAAYFQQQVQAGSLSEQGAQSIYEELMRNQQSLLELRDRFTGELQEKEYLMNERFVDSVYSFLERYNKDYGFQYILGYSKGSGILYASDTLDITQDVILGMNEAYARTKGKGK
ncbi:MAG TPA: OmpH family outer membrane protein [Bacteroidales bacterium]|nr:OmpH family outer membrane protein [Bacteroidales bacterium]HRZ75997.1 OmpH family outer membrane protein [Bacteroidales bacterium]